MRAEARAAVAASALLALAALVAWKHDRLRHLALPVLARPTELPLEAPRPIAESPACELDRVSSLGARITALLTAADGARWAGTFDRGVFRGERQLVSSGRQRFVNALVEHQGSVWAATYAGVLEYAPDGALRSMRLPGVAAEALLVHDGALYVGTVRGLFRDFRPTGDATLRVTSLARAGGQVWVGTPSGVYESDGRWHPLVFGPQAASTNVVLALVAHGPGVLALTDNGGIVDVQPGREVRAFRFAEPRANEGNLGAALATKGGALFGTQGGGLLGFSAGAVARPRSWRLPVVTALSEGLLGDGDGGVWQMRCARALAFSG